MIKLTVPATSANLGAGFDALGVALTLYNDVFFDLSEKTTVVSLDGTDVPLDEKNLIVSSAQKLYQICGVKFPGLNVRQLNRIPMARGLGSSSACIAAGLVGANHLLGNPLTESQLIDFAARIEGHPDNTTPALLGGLTASVFDGTHVYWARQEVPKELLFCAIVPDMPLSTEMAREILPKTVSYHDAVFNLSRAVLLTLSLLHGKYENLKIASEDLLHQPYRFPLIRGAEEIRVLCEQLGRDAFYLSGAGSTLMTIVRKECPFFVERLQKGLRELGFEHYQVFPLSVDHHGVRIMEEAEEK